MDAIGRHLARWSELPLQVVVEEEHFPAFRRFSRPWQIRPWQRQQIIKLNAPALTSSPFVLTLDPDVIAVKPIRRELLLPGGRALLEPESRSVHSGWWRDSSDLLEVDPGMEQPGINVTPALLSVAVLGRGASAAGGGRRPPWMEILLTSYCDWTEYTLYLLAAGAPACWSPITCGRTIRCRPPTFRPKPKSVSGRRLTCRVRTSGGCSPPTSPACSP